MNDLWDGTVNVPWRLLVVLCVLAFGGTAFVISAALDRAFAPAPVSRRERLDRDLDGVWDRKATEGIAPDTLRLFRQVDRLARLERANAPPTVLLHELSRIEATLADVGLRLVPIAGEVAAQAGTYAAAEKQVAS